MKRHARPLEAARWEYNFEDGTKEQVLKCLKAFQNDDGGFGHGIEPDFWLPQSSSMSTWAAGQILIEVKADASDEMVQGMISYLVRTYDHETGMWPSVLPENNNYPHAPWWGWHEGVQENWMFNPGVELAAFLIHWSEENSEAASIGWASVEKAVDHLMNSNKMDFHEVNNFQEMIRMLEVRQETFNERVSFSYDAVTKQINDLAEKSAEKDPSDWATGYKPLPLDFVNSPDDVLYERFGPSLIERNLEFFFNQMTDEGTWDVSWDWGSYPKEFAISRRYWQGILTVNRYKKLKSFGIE
ncbi:hypothetical protein E3U55_10555 [Filobacillus milosensis]|uniref:Squalene cyclase n=2 Tax=Filobacillus milosensis TaxID=94137 RepID=A0A4Y8IGI3_9BACI|nr:hypothetical protein E3U55_10555 [Filobacillus milosensis]